MAGAKRRRRLVVYIWEPGQGTFLGTELSPHGRRAIEEGIVRGYLLLSWRDCAWNHAFIVAWEARCHAAGRPAVHAEFSAKRASVYLKMPPGMVLDPAGQEALQTIKARFAVVHRDFPMLSNDAWSATVRGEDGQAVAVAAMDLATEHAISGQQQYLTTVG